MGTWCPQFVRTCALELRTRARPEHMVPTVSAHVRASSAHVRAKHPQFALQGVPWARGADGLCARARARQHMVPTVSAHVRVINAHILHYRMPRGHHVPAVCAQVRASITRVRAHRSINMLLATC